MKALYHAHGHATGGRTGHAESDDGRLKVDLSTPKELGGDGGAGHRVHPLEHLVRPRRHHPHGHRLVERSGRELRPDSLRVTTATGHEVGRNRGREQMPDDPFEVIERPRHRDLRCAAGSLAFLAHLPAPR